MKKRYYWLISSLIIIYYIFNNFLLKSMVVGTYHNINFKDSPIFPNVSDILKIFKDDDFYSNKLGYGNYKISYTLEGTIINLIGDEKIVNHHVSRTWIGEPKINIFFDHNHYYEKLTSKAIKNLKVIENMKRRVEINKIKEKEAIKDIQDKMYNKTSSNAPAGTTGK